MTLPPTALRPSPGERGRVTSDPRGMLTSTVAAWDDLIAAIEGIDLAAPSRRAGRSAARTLVVLGSWPEGRPLPAIRRDALAGVTSAEALDDIEGRMVEAHVGAPRADIIAALRRARDEVAEWGSSPEAASEALLPVGGPLGVVPLGTLVAATAYQCAVAGRDLEPVGIRVPDSLLVAGLLALIDTVGAVAAQAGEALALTAVTPQVVVGTGALNGDWMTRSGVAPEPLGPALECQAGLLLDIASGRASAPAAYARGEIRAHDLPGLFAVAQALARAPGLPGTEGLRTALQAYATSAAAARAVGDAVGSAWRKLRGG